MSEANSQDIGAVYQLFGTVAADVRDLRTDVRDLRTTTASMQQDIKSLRQLVTEYYASVLGHGLLISGFEERVQRIERHLQLPPAAE